MDQEAHKDARLQELEERNEQLENGIAEYMAENSSVRHPFHEIV